MDARLLRRAYLDLLEREALPALEPPRALDACVVCFSGERDVAEQAASLRSLLRHVGAPRRCVIVSDGTHRPRSRRLLAGIHPSVELVGLAEVAPRSVPPAVRRYARRDAFGRKLVLELALPLDAPTLYCDADVLFFARASALTRVRSAAPRYLRDCGAYFDPRLLASDAEAVRPANSGVFLLRRPLEWDDALARLARLRDGPVFHTEQTLFHLALRASGGVPLDPRRFVVSLADRYEDGDRFAHRPIALRHYTTPVRPKLLRAALRAESEAAGPTGRAPQGPST